MGKKKRKTAEETDQIEQAQGKTAETAGVPETEQSAETKKDVVATTTSVEVQSTTSAGSTGRSDKPLTGTELKERGLSFKSHPVTPKAHDWLKEKGINENQRLRSMLIRRAENSGEQLDLTTTQSVYQAMLEVIEKERKALATLLDEKLDLSADGTASCGFIIPGEAGNKTACGFEFSPMERNVVKNGEVLTHQQGPLAGQPITEGDFGIATINGTTVIIPLCPRHRSIVKRTGNRVYTKEKALYICRAGKVNRESIEMFQKSPGNRNSR